MRLQSHKYANPDGCCTRGSLTRRRLPVHVRCLHVGGCHRIWGGFQEVRVGFNFAFRFWHVHVFFRSGVRSVVTGSHTHAVPSE